MGTILRPDATLEDRYEATTGPVLLTGIQALVRMVLLRRAMDEAQGWKTGGFISGYRGSPLGGFDRELWRQRRRLTAHGIVFQPGLNEDLAATAVWGSQQVGLRPGAKVEGVFGIWYGKGPGVDRSGDVFRHANSAGTAPKGGVLALAGDDPSSKSSTITSGCEYAFVDLEMPLLDPADVAEVLAFGVKGIALSRFCGLWVGLKCVADTMDAAMTVWLEPSRYTTHDPEGLPLPPGGLHIRADDTPLAQEERVRHFRLPAAVAFARANGFDRVVMDSPCARFGIAVRGKAYSVLRQALAEIGISDELARANGLRLWKVGLAWPLDAEAARAFALGLEEILVIEDRRPLLEWQLRDALFHLADRPRVVGKQDEQGRPLLSDLAELDAAAMVRVLAARLPPSLRTARLAARLAELETLAARPQPLWHQRDPYFCPGCPHNTSTRIPEGSRALAGIGCHYLARFMDRNTEAFTHMGGEGVPWIGEAPFTTEEHVFANLGDGTWAHSGSLAVRFALAAGVNITYKILVNGAVAMTGGQRPEGAVDVPHIAAQLRAEGVQRIAIVADDPDRYHGHPLIPPDVTFHHRRALEAVQQEMRSRKGVSAIIYDQECATERRRKRKRGLAPVAERRVVINPRVCEDCGDCSRVSNCLAVEPLETAFGRKRRIDQSGCNQDFSCLEGFCPAFVTLRGAVPLLPSLAAAAPDPPEPPRPDIGTEPWNLLMVGIGGQGVSSLAAILAEAAHLEGRPVRSLDLLGLARKGGGVYAQLRIGRVGEGGENLAGARIAPGGADVMIAADLIVAHGPTAYPLLSPQRTVAVVNSDLAPTAAFVKNTATRYRVAEMLAAIRAACRDTIAFGAASRVEAELGDVVFLNIFLLGVAYQRGLIPLSAEAICRAITLNGVEVERNHEAFRRGRLAALGDLAAAAPPHEPLDALIARRIDDLIAYQNARYARVYADFVTQVRAAENAALPGQERLTRAVAIQLHRLMAYKDEYEVARLHTLPEWRQALAQGFVGTRAIEMYLAPPLLGGRKRRFGPWMFWAMGWLRHGKWLRGTPFDPFGWTAERRTERALPAEFRQGIERFVAALPQSYATACAWAEAWEGVKGFGAIKARNLAAVRAQLAVLEGRAAEVSTV